ncbi:MAG: hypothetical protein K0S32_788 [Bacteroidetes bacterium]|jgi:hypothetical protein|nr:hypothetical protein [Bacteroidota bacterium]
MKHFLFFFLSVTSFNFFAQDTVVFKNSDKLRILLLEVNPDNIKYKRFDNQAGATYTVLKSEISYIRLSNGQKEVFDKTPSTQKTLAVKDSVPVQVKDTITAQTPSTPALPANDTVYFKNGKKVAARIYELSDTEIKYKPIGNLDGPVYKIPKSDVKEIMFSTGMKQKFETTSSPVNTYDPVASSGGGTQSYVMRGAGDAKIYYRHRGGAGWVGVTAAIFPLAGLVPAIICSSVPPKQHNLGYPDQNLWQNKDYRFGYQKEAYRIKRKRVWTGFGIGCGTAILLFILASQ